MNDSPAGEPADVTMHVIPAEECYVLLGTQEIGRLGLIAGHYPLIFPVNYALDGTTLVIRTHAGTILQAAEHANVTFEIDEIDRRARSGWRCAGPRSGRGGRGGPPCRTRGQHACRGVEPWAPGDKGHWLRIIPHEISGRRIVPGELLAWTPAATSDPALGARSVPVLHRPSAPPDPGASEAPRRHGRRPRSGRHERRGRPGVLGGTRGIPGAGWFRGRSPEG